MYCKIKLSAEDQPAIGGARLWLDGKEITGLRNIRLTSAADDIVRLNLEITPSAMEIEGRAEVVKEPWRKFRDMVSLIRLQIRSLIRTSDELHKLTKRVDRKEG